MNMPSVDPLPPSPDSIQHYYTIGDVADALGVPKHAIRLWETRFDGLSPLRWSGKRYYSEDDVRLVRRIYHLIYVEGRSLEDARTIIDGSTHSPAPSSQRYAPSSRADVAQEPRKEHTEHAERVEHTGYTGHTGHTGRIGDAGYAQNAGQTAQGHTRQFEQTAHRPNDTSYAPVTLVSLPPSMQRRLSKLIRESLNLRAQISG